MRLADKQTAAVFADLQVHCFGAELLRVAQRKLAQLHRGPDQRFGCTARGNSMEKFSGNRNGQWSIRINDR